MERGIMTTAPRKALIIGAGIAGLATATLLRRAGFEAEVYEAWPEMTDIGGGLQIAPNGMHVLAELGLDGEVKRAGSVASGMTFHAQSGRTLGAINRNMETRFGQPAVNIRRGLLHDMLLSQARWHAVDVRFGKRLVGVDDLPGQPLQARFNDGSSADGDFLIGADGVHSTARACVLPHGPQPFDTGLVGFGGFIPRALLDEYDVGHDVRMTFGRTGCFGYGFCGPDPASGAMWWSTQPAGGLTASDYRALGQREIKRHLRAIHGDWHQPIPDILDAVTDIVVTATLDVASLPTWRRGRTVLVGDAAHATSPHAGQGASLALEDASRLGRLVAAEEDLDMAFMRFEDQRRTRVERVVAVARQNGNNKREFGVVGAFVRDQMIRVMLPMFASRQDWMYDYDARAA